MHARIQSHIAKQIRGCDLWALVSLARISAYLGYYRFLFQCRIFSDVSEILSPMTGVQTFLKNYALVSSRQFELHIARSMEDACNKPLISCARAGAKFGAWLIELSYSPNLKSANIFD